jgi:exonuclease SbcC
MRILQLKFKNINSLAGYQELDFTKPEFAETGIFAITGKTGSGKSSVLDAITLALYGKTPRMEVTGNSNEVMTHGERDCFAEIVFESKGKKWKAAWKQELTKTGNLKQIERSIADENDTIVSEKASEANGKITEILGLNFEQFTKVILLAQGSFAAFLQADKSEKGELLEQITGTKIYGDISKKVFERNKLENLKLEKINVELAAIKTLSPEEIQKLQNEISDLEKQKKIADEELQAVEKIYSALEEIKKAEAKIKISQKELEANAENLKIKTNLQTAKNKELENKKTEISKILNGKEISYYHNEKEKIVCFGKEIKNLIDNIEETILNRKKIDENNKIESKKQVLESIEKHINLLQEIRNLQEYRKALEDGKECPLCGAKEHPFAKGNLPQTDELKNKQKQLADLRNEISSEEKALEKINEYRNKREQILLELGELECGIAEDENCINKLKLIRKQKQEEYIKIAEIIKHAETAEKEVKRLDGEILTISSEINAKKNDKSILQTKIDMLLSSIKEKQVGKVEKSFEELQAERKEKKQKSTSYSEKIGENRQQLKSNELNLEKSKQKQAEKERQQKTSDKWRRLDILIGSADGKKFRNYAQALTFANLIALTNVQLKKMSERYILEQIGGFDLLVIDKWQNCNKRTAQNLSGGEKFIVSLSLAIGLANMASHNVRIDTMFIDEGFGTLDSDYLDVALNALSNLQSEGKLIGVISHLSELKERIATHIEVISVGNGRSRVG